MKTAGRFPHGAPSTQHYQLSITATSFSMRHPESIQHTILPSFQKQSQLSWRQHQPHKLIWGEETFVLRQQKLVILSSCNKRSETLGNILAGVKALHHRQPGRGHSGTTLKRAFKMFILLEGKTQHSTATPFSCPLPSTCVSCVLPCVSHVLTHVCVCSSCLHTGEPENTKHRLFSLFISDLKVSHNTF